VTEEDKIHLKAIVLELYEIRKLIEKLAETIVNLSDKELLKNLKASQENLKKNKWIATERNWKNK